MKKGFTLVEMVLIICIISVLSLLSAPKIVETIESSNKQVCYDHQQSIMSEYYSRKPYSNDSGLLQRIVAEQGNKVCPNQGIITYDNGIIQCSIHGSFN